MNRFVNTDESQTRRRREVLKALRKSRRAILGTKEELDDVRERLDTLPSLKEKLSRFEAAGFVEQFREQRLVVKEQQILDSISGRLESIWTHTQNLREELPIDLTFLSKRALEQLPARKTLGKAAMILRKLDVGLDDAVSAIERALSLNDTDLHGVRKEWNSRRAEIEGAFEEILKSLSESAISGQQFIDLQKRIEELRPLEPRERFLESLLDVHKEERTKLLLEWESLQRKEYQLLERAANYVSKQLENQIEVTVTRCGNREPLISLFREYIGGRLSESIDSIEDREKFSKSIFLQCCKRGAGALQETFKIPRRQAMRIAQTNSKTLMLIEELHLPTTTIMRLNTAPKGMTPVWRTLDCLSTGQRATAVLLLLLLESDSPLVVDQPEDDLDNRFVTEGIVPRVRREKRRRQFVFSTHNANIPVLGDAEQIIGLDAFGDAQGGSVHVKAEHTGSIDSKPVRELVEEILEGGKDAFEMRRLKYGF